MWEIIGGPAASYTHGLKKVFFFTLSSDLEFPLMAYIVHMLLTYYYVKICRYTALTIRRPLSVGNNKSNSNALWPVITVSLWEIQKKRTVLKPHPQCSFVSLFFQEKNEELGMRYFNLLFLSFGKCTLSL